MLESGLPWRRPGKTTGQPSASVAASLSTAIAGGARGTRCSRPVGGELLLSPQSVEIIKFGDPVW